MHNDSTNKNFAVNWIEKNYPEIIFEASQESNYRFGNDREVDQRNDEREALFALANAIDEHRSVIKGDVNG